MYDVINKILLIIVLSNFKINANNSKIKDIIILIINERSKEWMIK